MMKRLLRIKKNNNQEYEEEDRVQVEKIIRIILNKYI